MPELAAAESELERRFLLLVEAAGLPIPEVQVAVEGFRVDALWRRQRLIVELDGHATHANARVNEEDRRRELALRRAGFLVCRYTWQQVTLDGDRVADDLRQELGLEGNEAQREPRGPKLIECALTSAPRRSTSRSSG